MVSFKLSKSNYIVASICLSSLNLIALSFLVYSVFAQSKDEVVRNQPPVVAEAVKQNECPLSINILNIDNSALSYQRIDLTLQNTGSKGIKAYVIVGHIGTAGKIATNSFTTKVFTVGAFQGNDISFERATIKEGVKVLLSVDYVLFDDNSSWGADTQGFSKNLAGEIEGRLAAIEKLKSSMAKGGHLELARTLETNISEIVADIPETSQPEGWKKGYQTGYKAVFSVLKMIKEGGATAVLEQLEVMEKIAKEGRQ